MEQQIYEYDYVEEYLEDLLHKEEELYAIYNLPNQKNFNVSDNLRKYIYQREKIIKQFYKQTFYYQTNQQTMQSAITYLDIVMVKQQLDMDHMNLLINLCLLIANKQYGGQFGIQIQQVMQATGQEYSEEQIQKYELSILKCLKWNLTSATCQEFSDFFLNQLQVDIKQYDIIQHEQYAFISLQSTKLFGYKYSSLAIGSLMFALDQLGQCIKDMTNQIQQVPAFQLEEIQNVFNYLFDYQQTIYEQGQKKQQQQQMQAQLQEQLQQQQLTEETFECEESYNDEVENYENLDVTQQNLSQSVEIITCDVEKNSLDEDNLDVEYARHGLGYLSTQNSERKVTPNKNTNQIQCSQKLYDVFQSAEKKSKNQTQNNENISQFENQDYFDCLECVETEL